MESCRIPCGILNPAGFRKERASNPSRNWRPRRRPALWWNPPGFPGESYRIPRRSPSLSLPRPRRGVANPRGTTLKDSAGNPEGFPLSGGRSGGRRGGRSGGAPATESSKVPLCRPAGFRKECASNPSRNWRPRRRPPVWRNLQDSGENPAGFRVGVLHSPCRGLGVALRTLGAEP